MMISSFWRHLAIIVKEDVSFFVQHYHHHTYLEMYSRFQANNMNAEMPKKSPLHLVTYMCNCCQSVPVYSKGQEDLH